MNSLYTASTYKKCKQCSGSFCAGKGQQRCDNCLELGQRRVSAIPRKCEGCQEIFTPAHRNYIAIFCSRKCKGSSIRERERQERKRRKQGIEPKPDKKARYSKVRCRNCIVCLSAFITKNVSAACKRCTSKYSYDIRKTMAEGSRKRDCTICGSTYSPLPNNTSKTCSDECNEESKRIIKRKAKSSRRAMIRNADREIFDPFEVLERDGWRCKLCGIDTPKGLRATCEDNAPELDHVIPLSKGGAHTRANTQCLCRACNHAKSDR